MSKERQKLLGEAVHGFQRQYPKSDSGDLQTFVLGQQSCEEIMQKEIDVLKLEVLQFKNLYEEKVKQVQGDSATINGLKRDLKVFKASYDKMDKDIELGKAESVYHELLNLRFTIDSKVLNGKIEIYKEKIETLKNEERATT